MSKYQKSMLFVATALSLTAPVAVRAADTVVAAGQAEIEEVVVTARRREERLQDVPISITVFNQQQLQNHNVMNAADLANYTPSLQSNDEFGSQNTSFAIRGFVQDIGTAPSVGVFFDDVVAPRGLTQGIQGGDGAGPGDFFDLQNVQILKGPQGTLFGRNTTGGDILLVPQKPTDEFGGYVQGSFGNYNLRGGQGVINIPVNDQIRLRFGIDHESRDGYLHNTSGIGPSDFDDVNYTALRASADIDITPDLEDYLVASYSNSDTHGDFQKLIACNPNPAPLPPLAPFLPAGCEQLGLPASVVTPKLPPLSFAPPQGSGFYDAAQGIAVPYSKLSIWRVINTTTWHASDNLTVKNIASYAELNNQIQNPLFGTDFRTINPAHPVFLQYPFQFASVTDITGGSFADQGTYTEEVQIQGDYWANRLIWQSGAYLEGSIPLAAVGSQSPVSAYCPNSAAFQCYDVVAANIAAYEGIPEKAFPTYIGDINYNPGTTNTNDYAIYGQSTYKLTDYLKLTGGFRYSWDRMSNTGRRIYYQFDFPQQSVPPYAPQPPMIVNSNCANPDAPGFSPGNAKAGFGTTPVPPGDCVTAATERSNAPTWLLDLDYTPTDDILVYAKWARGYRQGVVSPNVPAPYDITGPEKVDDYEFRLRRDQRDLRCRRLLQRLPQSAIAAELSSPLQYGPQRRMCHADILDA
jgi:iron complex outermembrane receptor protein